MSTNTATLIILIVALAVTPQVESGPVVALSCMSACNAGVVACYSSFGLVFGTLTGGLAAWPVVAGCTAAQGACMTACAASVIAPTP
uniref:Uncharacterized protein n=1 Tax=Plectus sambesii TaxID=2011161 RepID=A0A914WTL2_9BILA